MLRSIGAVATGYLVFAGSAALLFQLSGQDPHAPSSAAFKIGSVIWGSVFALIAGFLTAHIAGRRPSVHAGVVALLVGLGALASLILPTGDGARWSQLSALLVMAPLALLGGVIARRDV
jgi:hypothetical protein